ncbi:hypothetical protein LCGC14_0736060 [marine sediment metagenome]|uniref:Uncharacterized protein n=1 Tax=marine sediment metagenome TaxID=412755 RepID=A0A0F9QCB4_9ZZZZ
MGNTIFVHLDGEELKPLDPYKAGTFISFRLDTVESDSGVRVFLHQDQLRTIAAEITEYLDNPAPPTEPEPEPVPFQVGDVVRYIRDDTGLPKPGALGVVKEATATEILVEFFTPFRHGHKGSCGIVRKDCGRYFYPHYGDNGDGFDDLELMERPTSGPSC